MNAVHTTGYLGESASREAERREDMIHVLEDHSPEGRATPRKTQWREARILLPMIVIAATAVFTIVYLMVGWPAVLVGLALVCAWYWVGWWSEILAATDRRRDSHEFAKQVDRELRGGGARSGGSA